MKWLRKPDLQKALHTFNTDNPNWYGWKDIANGEVYSNIKVIKEGASLPTESQVNTKLAELIAEYDNERLDYKLKRIEEYLPIQEQLDMQYWDSVNGTTTWKDHIAKVKSDNPKPS